jgi:hypothetical protein
MNASNGLQRKRRLDAEAVEAMFRNARDDRGRVRLKNLLGKGFFFGEKRGGGNEG